MSNRALDRLLRSGGLAGSGLHVGRDGAVAVSRRNDPYTMFSGETYTATFSAAVTDNKKDYRKKENREESGPKKKKAKMDDDGSTTGDNSDSDDDGPHFKSSGIHAKGSDADSDGKKGEGKNKKKPSFADKDKNGKVDAFEKKK